MTTTVMKDLPIQERPYEKCESYGPEVLSDAELLAVILRSGRPGENSLALTQRLLRDAGGVHPLATLTRFTLEELRKIPGIGRVKGMQIQCIGEMARRMAREEARERLTMQSPKTIADYFMEEMCYLGQEEVRAAFLDTKHHLIRDILITRGTANASLITPREVFLAALRYHAVFVVLIHNHPSGDPTPSREDILITQRMKKAGELLVISLEEHIVIGDHSFVCVGERGLLS